MGAFSVVHGVLAFAIAGAAWMLYREIRLARPAQRAPGEGELYGVRGWLVWLVSVFLFIGPGLRVGSTALNLSQAVTLHPALAALPGWAAYTSATWMLVLAAALLSVAAGVGLEKQRDRRVVRLARATLWINGPAAVIFQGVVIPFAIFGKSGANALFYLSVAESIVGAAAWTAYLAWSRRVRNTYGLNPTSPEHAAQAAPGAEAVEATRAE